MATIQTIPNEILSSVLCHLTGADLLATSLVSHRFHTLSRSPLYQEPNLRIMIDEVTNLRLARPKPGQESVALFLRTLLLSPGRETITDCVRALSMDLEFVLERDTPTVATDELTAAASNLGHKDLPLTLQGAQLTLILRLLPRLTSLDLRARDASPGVSYTHLQDSLKCPGTLPAALNNIRVFKSTGAIYRAHITPLVLLALLRLPSIRELAVSITEERGERDQFMAAATIAAGTSGATKLSLYYSFITPEFIAAVLQLPQAVTHFSCAPHGPFYGAGDHVYQLRQALAPHEASLQELDLDYTDTPDLGVWSAGNTLGTLCGWAVLHTLKLPLVMLLGEQDDAPRAGDMLPGGMRSLCVYDDWFWSGAKLVDQLVALLGCSGIRALQNLTVLVTWAVLSPEVLQRLDCACREAGVCLIVDDGRMGEYLVQEEVWAVGGGR